MKKESWVPVNIGTKRFFTKEKGLNFYWKNKWEPFDFTEKAREKRMNGINTALCTTQIIRYYNPKFWAIENGSRSLIFDYMWYVLDFIGNKNLCNYYSYGLEILKPTIIYSNLVLDLKREKPTKPLLKVSQLSYKSKKEMRQKYGNISQVPPELYKDIMRQFNHICSSCGNMEAK